MAAEVYGVTLSNFDDPVRDALKAYEHEARGEIEFEGLDDSFEFEVTPDKPYSARATFPVRHLGEIASNLYVIIFAPGDGTGAEGLYQLDNRSLLITRYPYNSKVLPRSKVGTHSEGHLTIATQPVDEPNSDPTLFSGSLDLLSHGLRGTNAKFLEKIGNLGQGMYVFGNEYFTPHPTTTLTVGFHQKWSDSYGIYNNKMPIGERFGDPHAIYNPIENIVQVCGFLAITDDQAESHLGVLKSLRAVEPEIREVIGPLNAGTNFR